MQHHVEIFNASFFKRNKTDTNNMRASSRKDGIQEILKVTDGSGNCYFLIGGEFDLGCFENGGVYSRLDSKLINFHTVGENERLEKPEIYHAAGNHCSIESSIYSKREVIL